MFICKRLDDNFASLLKRELIKELQTGFLICEKSNIRCLQRPTSLSLALSDKTDFLLPSPL